MLCNEFLATIEPSKVDAITLSRSNPQDNFEEVIVTGFEHMTAIDFQCVKNNSNFPIENSLAAAWAMQVRKNISNVYLQCQSRAIRGHVDYFCNGLINGAIEFLLNATPFNYGSQSMHEHLQRFESKKYNYKNWALVNLVMTPPKKKGIVLPEKTKYLDRVYTLIYSENALYRGSTVINQPAILALPSQKNVKYVKRSKGNMTNKNTNRSYSTFVSPNHIIKKLIRSLV
jgi:hypothetical protein